MLPPPPSATKGRDPWPWRGAPLFPLTPVTESPPASSASTPSLEQSSSFETLNEPNAGGLPGEANFSWAKVGSKSS
ncbi:hypothetical protein NBRC10512v2_005082 [Rhodotorula toruloides]|uniref:RHTO0S04e04016g1_1 n=2 Tax=Rhodotorula toruloides TaxID=5286 RepID=A0A061AP46_RHOTO|nr:uncharacterized protein RHTO_02492 [Rhodotorula toruloides NP11]EMS20544.1 hypothetical protein RHTO_02492 [Rhodotorula toruloides NP11]CDR39330.1 RHTO0S04e04016g1_1 [Rhodotorula toruloides]